MRGSRRIDYVPDAESMRLALRAGVPGRLARRPILDESDLWRIAGAARLGRGRTYLGYGFPTAEAVRACSIVVRDCIALGCRETWMLGFDEFSAMLRPSGYDPSGAAERALRADLVCLWGLGLSAVTTWQVRSLLAGVLAQRIAMDRPVLLLTPHPDLERMAHALADGDCDIDDLCRVVESYGSAYRFTPDDIGGGWEVAE